MIIKPFEKVSVKIDLKLIILNYKWRQKGFNQTHGWPQFPAPLFALACFWRIFHHHQTKAKPRTSFTHLHAQQSRKLTKITIKFVIPMNSQPKSWAEPGLSFISNLKCNRIGSKRDSQSHSQTRCFAGMRFLIWNSNWLIYGGWWWWRKMLLEEG